MTGRRPSPACSSTRACRRTCSPCSSSDRAAERTASRTPHRTTTWGFHGAPVEIATATYINSTYRSLRYRMVDAGAGVRLDAAASIPPLLDFLFAVDGRVRPFNKYLEGEFMRRSPLGGRITLEQLLAILDGDEVEQHAVFCEVERITREHGFGDVVDAWEPDVPWLRGNRAYRAT